MGLVVVSRVCANSEARIVFLILGFVCCEKNVERDLIGMQV